MSKCIRCGQCCIQVGRTFWRNSKDKRVKALAKDVKSQDDGLPCGMMQMRDGVASCKLQTMFGYEAKPDACRDYPDDEKCFYEEQILH